MKICFVSDIYPLLDPRCGGTYGGAEVQQWKIARCLRRLRPDWRIEFLVRDYGQPACEEREGLLLRRTWRPPQPRWPAWVRRLRRALQAAEADLYYQRCAGKVTGTVGSFCARHGKRFVFAVANDRDVDGTFDRDSPAWTRSSYHRGLRLADLLVAQTEHQQRLIRERFGRESLVVRSIAGPPAAPPEAPGELVTWVGTLDPVKKRPELFVELARSLPDLPCLMVYRGGTPERSRELRAAAAAIPNLRLVEQAPPEQLEAFYRASRVLVCTSRHEGFPNVLLEAWAHGVPAATLFDPDGAIARHDLGLFCRTEEGLRAAVLALYDDPGSRRTSIEQYLALCHSPARIGEQYARAFEELAG